MSPRPCDPLLQLFIAVGGDDQPGGAVIALVAGVEAAEYGRGVSTGEDVEKGCARAARPGVTTRLGQQDRPGRDAIHRVDVDGDGAGPHAIAKSAAARWIRREQRHVADADAMVQEDCRCSGVDEPAGGMGVAELSRDARGPGAESEHEVGAVVKANPMFVMTASGKQCVDGVAVSFSVVEAFQYDRHGRIARGLAVVVETAHCRRPVHGLTRQVDRSNNCGVEFVCVECSCRDAERIEAAALF